MRMYRRILLKEFIPFFILGISFFSLILVLGDIFANLWRYLNNDVPFSKAIIVSALYAPQAVSFASPIGAMFAAAFSLGNLGARNELIAIYGSGVPLFRFIIPILVFALLLSIGGYFFEDQIAIPALKERNIYSKELLNIQDPMSRSQVAVIALKGQVVYYADYYNDEDKTLSDLTIVIQSADGDFIKRIDAEKSLWDEESGRWQLIACRVFSESEKGEIIQEYFENYQDERLIERPETFRLDTREIEEMRGKEARLWIEQQRRAGLPFRGHQAKLYQRYSIALTPFLVVLFSGALGGRFRRNILLMSLLVSLALSSGWYIFRMVATLLAEIGIIAPLPSAVIPYLIYLLLGIWFFRFAKT